MNREWTMIGKGLLVASAGAVALMFLIVGISAGYVGKFAVSITCLVLAVLLAMAFRTLLTPYLDSLDQRETSFAADCSDPTRARNNL